MNTPARKGMRPWRTSFAEPGQRSRPGDEERSFTTQNHGRRAACPRRGTRAERHTKNSETLVERILGTKGLGKAIHVPQAVDSAQDRRESPARTSSDSRI